MSLWRQVVEVIGPAVAARLRALAGGGCITIPARYAPGLRLNRLLDEQTCRDMIRRWPAQRLYVPSYAVDLKHRDHTIRQRRREGKSVPEIARIHNLSQRQVWRIVRSQAAQD